MIFPFSKKYPVTWSYQQHIAQGGIYAQYPGTDFGTPTGVDILAPEVGYAWGGQDPASLGGSKWVALKSNDGSKLWTFVHIQNALASGRYAPGAKIGVSDNSGATSGPHTHVSLRVNNVRTDPMIYLASASLIGAATPTDPFVAVLAEQRPDVIAAGVPVYTWWTGSGAIELLDTLRAIQRYDVLAAATYISKSYFPCVTREETNAKADRNWLREWYVGWGSKEYPTAPYIWGAHA